MTNSTTVAVVGLGYVGLPLAVEFGKVFPTIGFDLSQPKIDAYRRHVDPTGEVSTEDMKSAAHLSVTSDPTALAEADFIIVAVPTPIDDAHQPDFGPLLGASESVGRNMKRGAIVVFESTVFGSQLPFEMASITNRQCRTNAQPTQTNSLTRMGVEPTKSRRFRAPTMTSGRHRWATPLFQIAYRVRSDWKW